MGPGADSEPPLGLLTVPSMPYLLRPAPFVYLSSLQTFELEIHQGALWAHTHRTVPLPWAMPVPEAFLALPPLGVLSFILM